MKTNDSLLQINTRIWFSELKKKFQSNEPRYSLDSLPIEIWKSFKQQGFDSIYLMGVWEVDELTEEMYKKKNLKDEFDKVYPGWQWSDTCGSPFAIRSYKINPMLGNDKTLKILKKTLNDLDLELILDFVPNHFGLTTENVDIPHLFIEEQSFSESTKEYDIVQTKSGLKAIYHGKDPYFPPWEDTFQLDYSNPSTKEFMISQLLKIAEVSNGVRCDMAMLIVNRIIQQVWGPKLHAELQTEFWADAISKIKSKFPSFTFIAEVYWDMEEELIKLGFDFCYDKKLYDAVRDSNYGALQFILTRSKILHEKSVRFLENHDEQRAVSVFKDNMNFVAPIITYTLPGIKFFHEKQFEGFAIKESLFLTQRIQELENTQIKQNYIFLLQLIHKYITNATNWNFQTDIFNQNIKNYQNVYTWEYHYTEQNKRSVLVINCSNELIELKLGYNIKEFALIRNRLDLETLKVIKNNNQGLKIELQSFHSILIEVALFK